MSFKNPIVNIDSQLKFEEQLVPIFEKIKFEKGDVFRIPELDCIEDCESLFYHIYHGCLYNFFRTIDNKESLSLSEYLFFYDNYIFVQTFNGDRIVCCGKNEVLKITTELNEFNRNVDVIKPLYKDAKIYKIDHVEKIENFEDETKNFFSFKTEVFLKEKNSLNFEDFK